MNSWCESCARKNLCYVVDDRPKCFLPITNTASGTPESYLAKSLRYSQDSHEIAKTENNSEKPNNCEACKHWEADTAFCYSIADSDDHRCHYEPKDEPQKSCSTCGYSPQTPSCDTCDGYSNWWSLDDEPQTERSGDEQN